MPRKARKSGRLDLRWPTKQSRSYGTRLLRFARNDAESSPPGADALDLHVGEERHQRVRAHLHDGRHVELDQRLTLVGRQAELVGVGAGVGDVLGALVFLVRQTV